MCSIKESDIKTDRILDKKYKWQWWPLIRRVEDCSVQIIFFGDTGGLIWIRTKEGNSIGRLIIQAQSPKLTKNRLIRLHISKVWMHGLFGDVEV